MKSIVLLILLAAIPVCGLTQPTPDTLWVRNYPDLGQRGPDEMIATADGGFAITGYQGSQPPPGEDGYMSLFVTRLDGDGNVLWDLVYPGDVDHWIYGRGICLTPQGEFIVYGGRIVGGGSQDGQNAVILKVSADGNLIWYREYDLQWYEFPYSIQPTLAGGFILGTGAATYDDHLMGCLLKINADGDSLWAHCYESDIYAEYLTCAPDSGFVFAGRAGGGPTVVGVVRTDKYGEALWEYPYMDYMGRPLGIVTTADSNFVVGGMSFGPFFMKIDASGEILWEHAYDLMPDGYDVPETMTATSDGGFLMAGQCSPTDIGPMARHVFKIDAQGELVWDFTGGMEDQVYCKGICPTTDNGFATAGGLLPQGDPALQMLQVVRFGYVNDVSTQPAVAPLQFSLAQNYPNPFNPVTQINFTLARNAHAELIVFNSLGQRVTTLLDDMLSAGPHSITWDSRGHAAGEYVYQLKAGDFVETRKMILVK